MQRKRIEASSVGISTEAAITNNLEAQITRDLLILRGEAVISVYDPERKIPDSLLSRLGIKRTDVAPVMFILYKTGSTWPPSPEGVPTVKRDMRPPEAVSRLDGSEHVGYYLRPQGRDGPSLTDIYLNRSAPRGNGNPDPMVTLTWG